jgi:hypothetical protein
MKRETCGPGLRSGFFIAGRSLVCKREVKVPNVLHVVCTPAESSIVGVEYSPVHFVCRGAYSCCIFEVYSAANASIESQDCKYIVDVV